MDHTHPDVAAALTRLERQGAETQTAIVLQGEIIRTVVERLNLIVDLLTPNDHDGVALDELLAHLIKQNSEQLVLARRLLEALERLEQELPRSVLRALGSRAGGTSGS